VPRRRREALDADQGHAPILAETLGRAKVEVASAVDFNGERALSMVNDGSATLAESREA
jgi:hypothetical protein